MHIHFRVLSYKDTEWLRILRNKNKGWFLNPNEIHPYSHLDWFFTSVKRGDVNLLIYNELNEPIGFISVYEITPDGYASIGRMMVDENHRHKGYMTRTMIKVMELCKNFYDIKELRLEVKAENVIARELYTKMGFTVQGFTKDTYIMRKSLV